MELNKFSLFTKKEVQWQPGDDFILKTLFCYPIVIIIKTQNIILEDLDVKGDSTYTLEMNSIIIDATMQDSLLWIILQSNEIIVLDILKKSTIVVETNMSQYVTFTKLSKAINGDMAFTSESGEAYVANIVKDSLMQKMEDGLTSCELPLKKLHAQQIIKLYEEDMNNGLQIFLENNAIVAKCPVSGLSEVISVTTNSVLKKITVWDEYLVVTDTNNIVILDFENSKKIYDLEIINTFYTIAAHLNTLYYLSIEEGKVLIKCLVHGLISQSNDKVEDISTTEHQSEDILKTHVKSLWEAYLNHTADDIPQEIVSKLVSLYNQIDDVHFLVDVSSNIGQNIVIPRKIIQLLQSKVSKINDNIVVYNVYDLSIKCDLIDLINFKGTNVYKTVDVLQKTFVELCSMFLHNMDIDLASLTWLKYSEIAEPLSSNSVLEILNAIPLNTKMGLLIMWFKHFVPVLLDQNPYHVDVFVRWTTERVFQLESTAYWPKIGLKFIAEIKLVVEQFLKTVIIMPISLDDLNVIKDHISYIIELKENYRINMLLNELSSLSPIEVVLIMLHRCYTEDLVLFINNFLPKFSTRYNIDIDEILETYLNNEALSGGGSVDALRFTMLLEAFRKPYHKLDCLLNVLKALDVPWDEKITNISLKLASLLTTDFTLNESERHLAQEIADEINYAKLKVVLKKYNFSINCTDYILILHKIINNAVVSLPDLKTIVNAMTTFHYYGSSLYIDRCLRDCETKEALTYYKTLSKYESKLVIKSLVAKYEYYANEDDNNIQRSYIDFFKGTEAVAKCQIRAIQKLYFMDNSQSIKVSLNDCFLNIQQTENSDKDIKRYYVSTAKSKVFALLRKTSTCSQARNFVENLLETYDFEKTFVSDEFSSLLNKFYDGQHLSLLLQCYKIFTQLALECQEEYINCLSNILYILHSFIVNITTMRNLSVVWKFNYIYLPIPSLSSLNDQIHFHNKCALKDSITKEYIQNACIKNDFTSLRVFAMLAQQNFVSNNYHYNFEDIKDEYLRRVIIRLLSWQEIDEMFLTSLLLIFDTLSVEDKNIWLIETLKSQSDTLSPKIISYLTSVTTKKALLLDDEVSRSLVSYPPQYMLKTKFNLNLGEIALPDITEETWDAKMILFLILNQNPNLPMERLIEICSSLNVTLNDGLSLQLIAVLSSWEPYYKTHVNAFGNRHLVLEDDDKSLRNKCLCIWESIQNKEWLKDILNDFWENREVSLHGRIVSINPYYYEVYLCIFRLVCEKSSEYKSNKRFCLLYFLKEYTRGSAPQQYEIEMFSEKGVFPEIGYYRLPFNLFMREDMWINLKSEITLATYESWLPNVGLLSLDPDVQVARDMICSNALKQTMKLRSDLSEMDKETEPWQLAPREEPLLRAAQRCVRHIANMEWAGACLFYVLQGCARGADQVAAANFCYQFAKRWDALQPGNRAVRKMERFYSSLSTRHVLHKLEWATEELIHLAVEPTHLIRSIYLHQNLFEKTSRFDVNQAANEIADKNGINISSIRIQLLESILEKKNNDTKKNIGLERNHLLIAKYILKATCPKMGAIYLSRIAFDEKSDYNKCKKLRALQCLMSIVDPDTASKVTTIERETLWKTILEMFYVINLENIDMPWIVETFIENKYQALAHLNPDTISNVEGLRLISEISKRYGDSQYIEKLVPNLLRFNLLEELSSLLLKIQLLSPGHIYSAWRAVLLRPFENADYPITEKQKSNCIKAINIIPLCPVINDKDLVEIWKNCIRCKCFGFACLLLPYMSQSCRDSLVELRQIDKRNLIASLKNLQTETYLVSSAMRVLDTLSKPLKRI